MAEPVNPAPQGSAYSYLKDPVDIMLESAKAEREAYKKGPDNKDTFVERGNSRSIISPSGLIQTAAVPAGLAASTDTFNTLKKAWENVEEIPKLEGVHTDKVKDLNTQLDTQRQALAKAQEALDIKGLQLTSGEIPIKTAELETVTGKAKAINRELKEKIRRAKNIETKWETILKRSKKHSGKDPITKFTTKQAEHQLNSKTGIRVRIKAFQEQIKDTSKPIEAIKKEIIALEGQFTTLQEAPKHLALEICDVETRISNAPNELSNSIAASRTGRVTAVADALPGKSGYLAGKYAASDEFASFAAKVTEKTGKTAAFFSDIPLLGKALGFVGKILTPIGAAFAGIDCVKELYNAFTADKEESAKAWTYALCNTALTVGAGILGFVTGGFIPLMIYAGFGNLAYTLGKSILNGDLKKSVDWLWGTA